MVFNLRLSDSKSCQIFRTLLSILTNFSSTVIWIVAILSLMFSSPSLFFWFLGTVSRTQTIFISFLFWSYFSSLARSRYLLSFSPSFFFNQWSAGMAKSTRWQIFFFLTIKTRFPLLVGIGRSDCISKFQGVSSWCNG